MAINKTINIDINQNADEAAKDFKNLNNSVDNLNDSLEETEKIVSKASGVDKFTARLDELDAQLASGNLNTREMNKLLQEYQTVAAQAGTETPIGDRAIKSAAGLKDTLTDLQVRTKLLSSDYVKMDTTLAAIGTGAQAFSGIQSAMALTGVESEELQKTMVKLQAVQGVSNSISAVTNALNKDAILGIQARIAIEKIQTLVIGKTTGAMKLLRIAMASTGIGLLVAGIGLLIANFDKVWEVIKKGIDIALVPVKAAIDAVVDSYYAVTDALGFTSKAEREREKQAKQIASEEQKRAAERIKQYQELAKQVQKNIDTLKRLETSRQESFEKEITLLKASGKETRKVEREKLQSVLDTENKILQERKKTYEESKKQGYFFVKFYEENQLKAQVKASKEAEFQLRVFDAETNKQKADNYKAYAKTRQDIARQIEDIENDLLKDGIEKELEINRDKFRRLREDTAKNTELTATERKRLTELYAEQENQAEKQIRDKYKQLDLDREEAAAQALKEVKLKTGQETLDALQTQLNKEIELKRAAADKEAQIEAGKAALVKRNIEFAIESTKQGLEVILSLTELFGKKGEKQARKAFQVQKAAQIASATIDTYKNAVSAYGSQFVPVPDPSSPVRGGIAAGIAVAAGLANIAKIASQKFEGGGGGGGSVTEPSTAGLGGGAISPQFNVVGDSGINQLAQLQQQPVQAYVVSGEVTSAQALDRNRVKNATL